MSEKNIEKKRAEASKSGIYKRGRDMETFRMSEKYLIERLFTTSILSLISLLFDVPLQVFPAFCAVVVMYIIHLTIKFQRKKHPIGDQSKYKYMSLERGFCIGFALFINIATNIIASNHHPTISIIGYFIFIFEYVFCSFNIIRNSNTQLLISFPFILHLLYLLHTKHDNIFTHFYVVILIVAIYRSNYEENGFIDKFIYKSKLMKEKSEMHKFVENLPISIINYNIYTQKTKINKRMSKLFKHLGSSNIEEFLRKTFIKDNQNLTLLDVIKDQLNQYKRIKERRRNSGSIKNLQRTEVFIYKTKWQVNDIRSGGITPMISPQTTPREILLEVHFHWKSKEDCITLMVEEKMKKQQEIEEKLAMKCKDILTRAMSHNLKTPLNILKSFVTDDQAPIPYEDKRLLRMSATFLEYKIDDTIELSRIEAKNPSKEQARFKLDQIFEELCTLCLPMAELESVTILQDIKEEENKEIYGYKKQVMQILVHLLQNAIKYSHKQGVIRLFATQGQAENCVIVGVEDSGEGISPLKKRNIFNFLNIGDEGNERNLVATTFGLPITQEIAKSINSPLYMESKEGKGSKFYMVLSRTPRFSSSPILQYSQTTFDPNENFSSMILKKHKMRDPRREKSSQYNLCQTANIIFEEEKDDFEEDETEKLDSFGVQKGIIYSSPKPDGASRKLFNSRTSSLLDRSSQISDLHLQMNNCIKTEPLLALSVDDNGLNRLVIKRLLEKKGVKVLEASNGKEAIELILTKVDQQPKYLFDLIFMDLNMPVMDGLEATQRIKTFIKERKIGKVPIFAITAHDSEQVMEKCKQLGFDEYLTKPICADQIDQLLHKYKD